MPDDEDVIVTEFEKNAREKVRVRLTSFKGIKLIDVRTFYEDKDGDWKPGKGIALRRSLLPELITALETAKEQAGDTAEAE